MANRYALPLIGTRGVDELTPDDLRGLLTYIELTPPKVGGKDCNAPVDPESLDREVRRKRRVTANNTFSMVRSALNMAWEEGKAKNDDAWRRVERFRAWIGPDPTT